MRDKMRYIHIFVIIILLLISLSGCIEINSDEEKETMTALQAYEIAEETAKEWYDDSVLILVGLGGYSDGRGGAHRWSFRYYSPSNYIDHNDNATKYASAYIYIYANNDTDIVEDFSIIYDKTITNWTIDSDEAVEIAKQEPQIESYLDGYPGAGLGMSLKMWERLPDGRENPNQDSATWSIRWEHMGGMFDDPAHARVFINANTGEVLYVDADI